MRSFQWRLVRPAINQDNSIFLKICVYRFILNIYAVIYMCLQDVLYFIHTNL